MDVGDGLLPGDFEQQGPEGSGLAKPASPQAMTQNFLKARTEALGRPTVWDGRGFIALRRMTQLRLCVCIECEGITLCHE